MGDFKTELTVLLNRYSKENGSNTPDFLLAEYLLGALDNYETTINRREAWFGRPTTAERVAFAEELLNISYFGQEDK